MNTRDGYALGVRAMVCSRGSAENFSLSPVEVEPMRLHGMFCNIYFSKFRRVFFLFPQSKGNLATGSLVSNKTLII